MWKTDETSYIENSSETLPRFLPSFPLLSFCLPSSYSFILLSQLSLWKNNWIFCFLCHLNLSCDLSCALGPFSVSRLKNIIILYVSPIFCLFAFPIFLLQFVQFLDFPYLLYLETITLYSIFLEEFTVNICTLEEVIPLPFTSLFPFILRLFWRGRSGNWDWYLKWENIVFLKNKLIFKRNIRY